MNPELSNAAIPSANSPAQVLNGPFIDPTRLLPVLGDPARWAALRELVYGRPLSLTELARKAGRKPNQMGKHMAVLQKLGVVMLVASPDGDGRKQTYALPETFRRTDAEGRLMLDFGVCLLRFGDDVRERVSLTAKD